MQLHEFAQRLFEVVSFKIKQRLHIGDDLLTIQGQLILFHDEGMLGSRLDRGQIDELHHALACRKKAIAVEQQALLNEINGLLFRHLPCGVDRKGHRFHIDITDDLLARQLFIEQQNLWHQHGLEGYGYEFIIAWRHFGCCRWGSCRHRRHRGLRGPGRGNR